MKNSSWKLFFHRDGDFCLFNICWLHNPVTNKSYPDSVADLSKRFSTAYTCCRKNSTNKPHICVSPTRLCSSHPQSNIGKQTTNTSGKTYNFLSDVLRKATEYCPENWEWPGLLSLTSAVLSWKDQRWRANWSDKPLSSFAEFLRRLIILNCCLLYMHRKKQRECPNPLFLKWLEEWRDEAKQKSSKLQYTYAKVRDVNHKHNTRVWT